MSDQRIMTTPWGDLYRQVQIAEEKAKEEGKEVVVHRDPLDPSKGELPELDKFYLKARMRAWDQLETRRTYKTFRSIIYKQTRRVKDGPQRVFSSEVPYIFLQYIGVLYRWAQARYKLKEVEVSLLLYVYPIGIFDRLEWGMMAEVFGYEGTTYQSKLLRDLKNKGMIRVWMKQRKDEGELIPTLYCLTEKAKDMCSKLHTMSLGKTEIPVTHRNPLSTYRESSMNKIFERMNSRVKK